MRRGTTPPVEAYLARLRLRAALLYGTRALIAAGGGAAVAFAVGALLVGPLSAPALAVLVWGMVLAPLVAVGVWAWIGFAPLRGAGAASLLSEVGGALPSAARSAYELGRQPATDASAAMIEAHGERVRAALAEIPPSEVVRWRSLRHRAVALGVLGAAVAAVALTTERGGAGAYALIHPGERDGTGQRVAVAFGDVEARLVYPSYLGRESTVVLDPTVLEVPRGTSVELTAAARLESRAASMRVGERVVPLELDEEGRWTGRFVTREDGLLVLRLQRPDGDWVRDAMARSVRALEDEAPGVSIIEPTEDRVLEAREEIAILWEAHDDVGLAGVDLVAQMEGGEEQRRRLASFRETEQPAATNGRAPLDLSLLGMIAGQSVTVWIEARDADVVSGPNVGRSARITLTLASEATRRERRLASLEDALERGLSLLADRLETPVPEAPDQAVQRFDALRPTTNALVETLRTVADEVQATEDARASDVALVRGMASRLRRLVHEERLAHGRRPSSKPAREGIDARAVTELEDDVLTLDDLLGRARVEDAAEIARELESIRREISSLLSELRRTDSPEARERLLAAIGRAQARLQELMQRIAEMGTNVPQEFMNAGEMPTQESVDALERLSQAIQRGDLEAADQLVNDLQRQIDQIARALGQTEQGFAESRFGPRDRAMANAMDALASLEAEQQQLSRRGSERRGRAAERALETIGGQDNRAGRRLADQTRDVRRALERVERAHLAGFEQDSYDRVRQRLIDAEDALRAGDLGEGRAMSQAAAQDLSSLSRDLDLSALMFPGHGGETSDDAQDAREANGQLRDLRRQLDESLPDVASHLTPQDRQQLQGDLPRQRDAQRATERLRGEFAEGPDGAALSEEAAAELGEAARAMQQANRAIEGDDPLESARFQEEAARRLTELREELENQQSGGGNGGSDGQEPDHQRPVEIPDADQFEGPMEMRRRLLDAMREAPQQGYEDAVRRYYEGLLR